MKLYKDYTKEPFSFLANYTTSRSDNPLRFRKNLLQNDNKIKQNKAQCNLDRQTATISPLLSRNVVNIHFWQTKMFYWKKTCYKKLLISKDLNTHHWVKSWKCKLALQNNNNNNNNNNIDDNNNNKTISRIRQEE